MDRISNPEAVEDACIAIVDFAGWANGGKEQRKGIATQLTDACRSVGFVYIVNHGIPSSKIAETFSWTKRLFALDRNQKMLAPHPNGSAVHRGYSWPGLEKVSQLYGDEEDADLAKQLREITDVKVRPK
jgi:isopenicillin N synthase-like dioxygenase